jgi:transcriptional regulator with XRE-family HTH domain
MLDQENALKVAGATLRSLREAQGLSQEELALEAGVDQSRLSKIERLGPQAASWAQLLKITAALGHIVEISYHARR